MMANYPQEDDLGLTDEEFDLYTEWLDEEREKWERGEDGLEAEE